MGRGPILSRTHGPFVTRSCEPVTASGISPRFRGLSRAIGQVAHALLTRSPLGSLRLWPKPPSQGSPLDLHVLGTPPAFVLSQDQTLHEWYHNPAFRQVLQPHPKSLVRLLSPSNPSLADALASDASSRNRKDPLLPSGTLFSCQGPTLRSFRSAAPSRRHFSS